MMNAAIIKTGCGVAAVLLILFALQTSVVLNAILVFAAAGVVPGTDIKLAPDATLWALGGLGLSAFLLIFSGNIVRLGRSIAAARGHKREQAARPVPEPSAAVQPPAPQPVVIITIPGQAGYLVRIVRMTRAIIVNLLRLLHIWAPVAWRTVRRKAQLLHRLARQEAAQAWGWLQPQLLAGARYLTAKLNQHQDITPVLQLLRACAKVLSKWLAQAKTHCQRYLAKLT